MPEITRTLTAAGRGDVLPWLITTPPAVTDYTIPAANIRVSNNNFALGNIGGLDGIIVDGTTLTGNIVASRVELGLQTTTQSRGPLLLDSSGNGIAVFCNDTNIRLFTVTAYASQTTTPLKTIVITQTATDVVELSYNKTTGVFTTLKNTVSVDTYAGTAGLNLKAASITRSALAGVKSLTSVYTPSQTITSINGGSPITQGQASVVALHTGFTGAITSITTNKTGLTATVISGDANSTTFSISGWTDGAVYPLLDSSVEFTFTRASESALLAQTVTYSAGMVKQTFTGAITANPKFFGYHAANAGYTVEGSTLYMTPVNGSVMYSDSGVTIDSAGTTTGWMRDTVTGVMSYWTLVFNNAGEVVSADPGIAGTSIKSSRLVSSKLKSSRI